MNAKKAKALRQVLFASGKDYHKERLYNVTHHTRLSRTFVDVETDSTVVLTPVTLKLAKDTPHALYREFKRRSLVSR